VALEAVIKMKKFLKSSKFFRNFYFPERQGVPYFKEIKVEGRFPG
jgi:hypothetical protein